jgi:RNA polymerase sigma-70 factor (ECF subfamily)
MSQRQSKSVSALLAACRTGADEPWQAALPLIYNELRRVAHRYLRNERSGHTLQSTALVHEVYLRLQKQGTVKFENRTHFVATCAQLMRQILVDYARRRRAAKRDGGQRLTLDDSVALVQSRNVDFEVLDNALEELKRLDPQQSRIVELRFFGGLSIEETAQALDISPATVKRDWATARVWLHREMSKMASYDS